MSVITKDLGIATAYGYAKSKGYTGTEEEFAELMASYADVAQQAEAAAQDAEDAKDAAITAKTAAQTAQTAAESAQAAAAGSAQTASTKASEASGSAQTAAGSATAAGNSATAAAGSATTAQTAAQTATTKASEASSSASAAGTAKTGAETARTGAQTAQAAAETAQENAEAAAASVSASAAQIDQNTEDITGLKNDLNQFPNGTYPNMSVGNADQLTATVGIEDNTPYLFRTSGGTADIGDREDVRKIVGGTIAWNQLVVIPYSVTKSGITFTNNNNGSITINGTASSTVYEKFSDTVSSITNHVYYLEKGADGSFALYNDNAGLDTGIAGRSSVGKATADKSFYYYIASGTTIDNVTAFPQITDLTLALGTAIADYVYSLEQATAGAGVAWLKKHFPAQFNSGYQAYDAGTLKSIEGLSGKKTVGFNQWDEEWEVGSYSSSMATVQKITSDTSHIMSKNPIPVLEGMTYYMNSAEKNVHLIVADDAGNVLWRTISLNNETFNIPSGGRFVYFNMAQAYGTTYNHDICINLHWDGERDGEYEPYVEYTYPLDDSLTLRGIPKLDNNNQLYYDGDEYLPDGTVNRRYGIVDLGAIVWKYFDIEGHRRFIFNLAPVNYAPPTLMKANAMCNRYEVFSNGEIFNNEKIGIAIHSDGTQILVYDPTYTDAATFKTAMSGVYLVYELATPTTETADSYQETQIVDDFGTEEFVLADGAFPVPVGHYTMYQNNLRAKLEMAPDSPDGDGLYVVQQENGQNEYVPLASTSTIQDILTRLTALENENA